MMTHLLNTLLSSAQAHLSSPTSSSPALLNSLTLLSRLLKEWTTIKLPLGTKVFTEWVTLWMPVLVPLLEQLGQRENEPKLAWWCFKCVSRLVVWDYSKLASSKSPETAERATVVFALAVGQLGAFVQRRSALLDRMRTDEGARGQEGRARLKELTAIVKSGLKYLRVRAPSFLCTRKPARILTQGNLLCFVSTQRMQEANPGEFASLPEANSVILHLWNLTRSHLDGDFHAGSSSSRPSLLPTVEGLSPDFVLFFSLLWMERQRTKRAPSGRTTSKS